MASVVIFFVSAFATVVVTCVHPNPTWILWVGVPMSLVGVGCGILQKTRPKTEPGRGTPGIILNALLCVSVVLFYFFAAAISEL